jgi:plasmid stabilization system protein ParE
MRLAFSAVAQADIDAAASWYEMYASSRLQQRLMTQIDRAFMRLLEQPLMGAPGVAGTRKWVITGFPYLVIYRVDGDTLQVLAFRHRKRRPGLWQRRS